MLNNNLFCWGGRLATPNKLTSHVVEKSILR